jgi:acyl carrier protein
LLVGLDGENGNIQKRMEWIDQSRQMTTAYITTKDGAVVEEEIEHLSLPDRFGIPTRCSPWRIDDMPLTDSGDVDTTRLQALASGVMYEPVSPQTPLEESLAKIWAEVLGVNTVGIHDDFFEIGGDSMRAARLLATIKQELDFSLPIDALFQHPSVAEFSKAIQDGTLSANGPVTALLKQSNDAQHLLLKPTLLGQMSDAYQRLVRTIGLKLKSLLN